MLFLHVYVYSGILTKVPQRVEPVSSSLCGAFDALFSAISFQLLLRPIRCMETTAFVTVVENANVLLKVLHLQSRDLILASRALWLKSCLCRLAGFSECPVLVLCVFIGC